MKGKTLHIIIPAVLLIAGCSAQGKLAAIRDAGLSAGLSLPDGQGRSAPEPPAQTIHDTLTVQDMDGREVVIMKAVRDDDGQMVAHDVIDAAMVTARFRNVAERHGRVDLSFDITVPEAMQDQKWQIRIHPDIFVMDDSTRLDPILITGSAYRKAQLRGYQLYGRFLDSIVSDTTTFINRRQLEIFLHRNIPQVYAFRSDTTLFEEDALERILSDRRDLSSVLGATKDEAVEHYTDRLARWLNRRRINQVDSRYARYVKAPMDTDGIRLDTVMRSAGAFTYCYTTSIRTRPGLRKADVVLSGDIREQDRRLYEIPRSEPLTFYISSLSAFVDPAERYLTRIVERRASVGTTCRIVFAQGQDGVTEGLGDNASELSRIRGSLRSLLEDSVYDLDSVCVTAASSPEGSHAFNARLSDRRSKAVAAYMGAYMRTVRDSILREGGFMVDEDGRTLRRDIPEIPFRTRTLAEDWESLDGMVAADAVLTRDQKKDYCRIALMSDPDAREAMLRGRPYYPHLRDDLYPRVRTVRFDFHLHRKGMVQDTLRTTVIDSVYMSGVQAIKDRDYETAVTILRPYGDFNAAVAFCCLDYNASAMSILKDLEPTPPVLYMKAIVLSRMGDAQAAVQNLLDACRADPPLVHRANLDPEMSQLVKDYSLSDILTPQTDL